ncbi:MAG: hypothetical protein CM1200mP2_52550 [Planctomycetaceae bacterium]|nr:MAG: hypothetical protein CM1200mP2_52550 [Planctomycetaceae bacterium]
MADQDNGPSSEEPQQTSGESIPETPSESVSPTPPSEDQGDQSPPAERPLPDGAVAITDDDGEIPDPNDSGMPQPNRRRRRRRRRRGRGGRGGNGGGGGGGGEGGAVEDRVAEAVEDRVVEADRGVLARTSRSSKGVIEGVLELHPKGYGFLRDPQKNYASQDSDPFVSSSVVERFGLRAGGLIKGVKWGRGRRGRGHG